MPALTRPQKITFGDMRDTGVRGVLIYCADYKCSHSIAISADPWPGDVRLSDIEPLFVCQACGKRGGDVRPDFNWNKKLNPGHRTCRSDRATNGPPLADRGWKRRFDEPIRLPGGGKLFTLKDAIAWLAHTLNGKA